jgi:nitrite reductase/ring-hydroxylating ferredoxin subunit
MSVRLRLHPDQLKDVMDGQFTRLQLPFASVLVGKVRGEWRAYKNVCPHRLVPLDFGGTSPMSDDRAFLLCNQHGALFRPSDGFCIEGPCYGDALTPLRIEGHGDEVVVEDVKDPWTR